MKIGDKVVWIPDNAKGEVKELFDEFNQVKYKIPCYCMERWADNKPNGYGSNEKRRGGGI